MLQTYCCALRLWSQMCITCRSCWFPDLIALFCCAGAGCLRPRDGWFLAAKMLGFSVCGLRQNLHVFSLYRNPDLDFWTFDSLLTSMTAVQAEDVRASFLFVGDLNGHHQEWLGSTTANSHGVVAFDFTTVSRCDQLAVGQAHARGFCCKPVLHVFLL